MTTGPDPNYRHPKCYANLHGGCSTKISGEHYISHSLIKLYTFDDPDVKVKHNNGFGIRQDVSPKNFVVNALCTNHNTALSVTDATALEFAKFLRGIAIRFLGGAGEWGNREEIIISGDDLERWALKLLLNHAAGKAFSVNKGQVRSPIPPVAVDFSLSRTTWPFGMGLCVAGVESGRHRKAGQLHLVRSYRPQIRGLHDDHESKGLTNASPPDPCRVRDASAKCSYRKPLGRQWKTQSGSYSSQPSEFQSVGTLARSKREDRLMVIPAEDRLMVVRLKRRG